MTPGVDIGNGASGGGAAALAARAVASSAVVTASSLVITPSSAFSLLARSPRLEAVALAWVRVRMRVWDTRSEALL